MIPTNKHQQTWPTLEWSALVLKKRVVLKGAF